LFYIDILSDFSLLSFVMKPYLLYFSIFSNSDYNLSDYNDSKFRSINDLILDCCLIGFILEFKVLLFSMLFIIKL